MTFGIQSMNGSREIISCGVEGSLLFMRCSRAREARKKSGADSRRELSVIIFFYL